jgi:hypothetical protein
MTKTDFWSVYDEPLEMPLKEFWRNIVYKIFFLRKPFGFWIKGIRATLEDPHNLNPQILEIQNKKSDK